MKKQLKNQKVTDNSNYLVERKEIEGTPFTAVKLSDENWILTCGKYRLSEEPHKSLEETKKFLDGNFWKILLMIVSIFAKEK